MKPKLGVSLEDLRPELRRLEPLCDLIYGAAGCLCIVTSTNHDGYSTSGRPVHMATSLHYQGLAMDLRTHHLGDVAKQRAVWRELDRAIDTHYPGLYDVLYEGGGTVNAHIHVEASPTLVAQCKAAAAAGGAA